MLFRADAFEPLSLEPWDEQRIRRGIAEIVADVDEAFDPVALWSADEWDAWGSPRPLTGLYVGAAGVVWALDALRRRGHAEVSIDLVGAAQRALERGRRGAGALRGGGPRAASSVGSRASEWRDRSRGRRLARGRRAAARVADRATHPAKPGERCERGDVGSARHAPRCPGDARLDGRRELGRCLADGRRLGLARARRGRGVDPAAPRQHRPPPRRCARLGRKRAGTARQGRSPGLRPARAPAR